MFPSSCYFVFPSKLSPQVVIPLWLSPTSMKILQLRDIVNSNFQLYDRRSLSLMLIEFNFKNGKMIGNQLDESGLINII